ncbi:MAG: hypothetical protein K5928_02910 [Prevotella sp.]|nr:hypothetical protein [Prevotella sp.]
MALLAVALLSACSETGEEAASTTADSGNARKLQGIKTLIDGGTMTRAAYTPLADYVGRRDFNKDDIIMFTKICRTTPAPIAAFTYPQLSGTTPLYEGVEFLAETKGGGWARTKRFKAQGEPEDIYWSDAESPHTFEAYGIPSDVTVTGTGDDAITTNHFDWKRGTAIIDDKTATFYMGSIGNPRVTDGDIIDYTLTAEEQEANSQEIKDNKNNVIGYDYYNPKLEKEDLLIAYDTQMQAEPGGSVALVKFHHALSSVRVVVKLSGFSSTDADNKTTVSDMYLLHQPTMYVWMMDQWQTQPLRAHNDGSSVTNDQPLVNSAWAGEATIPSFDQRKDMKLWIPKPEGSNPGKSDNEFTFYGITTPQPSTYISTVSNETYKKTQLRFTVTYPNPLKPSDMVPHTYTAELDDVYFEPGFNTTINIQLNHEDEEITVGAEYESWEYIATPDQGVLKKNSTFLQDTSHDGTDSSLEHPYVTIVGDAKATADDATWLYESAADHKIYDIYGHDGSSEAQAYQISTAFQLVSFAYEVKGGRDFTGKYVRLDADLTLQKEPDKTKSEIVTTYDDQGNISNQKEIDEAPDAISWIGIGDASNPFNGTFLGGHRFIHRLSGQPLFAALGPNAKVKQLQLSAISIGNGTGSAVTGGGIFAEVSAGRISGCRVVGDVTLSGSTGGYAGAFVGQNFIGTDLGALYASYHVGNTKSTGSTTHVGGLVGNNGNGIISGCFQAGVVSGGSSYNMGIAGDNSGDNIYNTYFNSSLFTYSSSSAHVQPKTTAEMTKQQFVDELNQGITIWRTATTDVAVDNEGTENDVYGLGHTDYDDYRYIYQPAGYPYLSQ